ncbi:MATE family efflux transporter DinF [Vibrio sp. SS-MA-C1-2]|uniref:MATE family efflux transporter DinF n=1 Tax=Vibrio sp. SS-MA-C1-2 TaxID=2908646 RepID=UPI001F1DD5BD|nr:MATE family efflux transporter DinF [Vibrio sp. SS-MA-C1-2]UJF19397.1 MATE family efflux transporter DinF [Vibrio sp. SS-MA-C1-2]
MISVIKDIKLHRHVFSLALPMVLSNITVPLLSLVDAAVIGHLDKSWYLGGVAIGGSMISMVFMLLLFLRMATTGLTAQAFGRKNSQQIAVMLLQGVTLAWILAGILLLIHQPLSQLIFSLSNASEQVIFYGQQYFEVRIWSAPAALANLVIMGWLLGTQNSRYPMWLLIFTNLVNILLDLLFVMGFGWQVKGAAFASVIADYSSFGLGLWFVAKQWRNLSLPSWKKQISAIFTNIGQLLHLNKNIMLRSLCLQVVFAFMAFQGAALGDDIVAANAVLMSFLMMISYAMDGFAYAMEAMVGNAVGAKNKNQLIRVMQSSTFLCLIICLVMSVIFFIFGDQLIGLISNIAEVRHDAAIYLPWLAILPLVSMWCFLLDGIFVGAAKGKEMRNSMFIATISFFIGWWLLQGFGNHALWSGMLIFMAMRGVTLGGEFYRQWQTGRFIAE